jgi:5'/3'-nucleotidase
MGRERIVRIVAGVCAAALALAVAACGGSDDDEGGAAPSGDRETTTTVGAEPVQILVTNDDGVGAEGIDTLVTALSGLDGVEVTVVAPATQQSGTGGNATDGPLTTNEAQTASGHPASAVDGFPADTIRVAFDEQGVEPDLVVAGINEGQNLGPLVDVSGTIGAARAAVRRGVPALAVSQGLGADLDYDVAAGLVTDWVEQNLDAIRAGDLSTTAVLNLNVPTCDTGELRGEVEVASATAGNPVAPSDCTSTADGQTDDVAAFTAGFATLTEVPVDPATGG